MGRTGEGEQESQASSSGEGHRGGNRANAIVIVLYGD